MQASQVKIEYGDFQTPPELTEKICQKLWQIHVNTKSVEYRLVMRRGKRQQARGKRGNK
ncbi:MAG: hypothetical protein ACKO8H_06290 [Microcystis panniformis]